MTPTQLHHLEQDLNIWREKHPDLASCRAAYRRKMVEFTLNSMAMEREPVDQARLLSLLHKPARRPDC